MVQLGPLILLLSSGETVVIGLEIVNSIAGCVIFSFIIDGFTRFEHPTKKEEITTKITIARFNWDVFFMVTPLRFR